MAFEPGHSYLLETVISTVELVFILDIAVAFRTSYLTFEGQEITDWRKIGARYLHHHFIIDILSVLPFSVVFPEFKLIGLVNIIKIVHV